MRKSIFTEKEKTFIKEIVKKESNLTKTVISQKGNAFQTSWSGRGNVLKWFNFLYEEKSIFLERKKKIFLKLPSVK